MEEQIKIVKGKLGCLKCWLVFQCFVLFIFLLESSIYLFLAHHRHGNNIDITQNHLILWFGILVAALAIIYGTSRQLSETYNDLFDYLDIQYLIKVQDFPGYLGKKESSTNFVDEIWYNINRRGEKAKIKSLNNIESKLEKVIEIILELKKKTPGV
jgi:hypothetical protein